MGGCQGSCHMKEHFYAAFFFQHRQAGHGTPKAVKDIVYSSSQSTTEEIFIHSGTFKPGWKLSANSSV